MPSWLTAFLYTIILLAVLQGAIMGGLLFFSKKQRYTNRLLAVLIFIITLASFNLWGSYKGWFGSPVLNFLTVLFPMVVIMPAGPLIYFYVRCSLNPQFSISKKQKLLFLPTVIDLVPSLTVITYLVGLVCHFFKANNPAWGNFIDTYNVYADIPRWASLTFYVWLSIKHLNTYKAKAGVNSNAPLPVNFKWLQFFLRVFMVFQSVWLVFLIPYVIPQLSNKLIDSFDWFPLYIPMAVMVYLLGIKGYIASNNVISSAKPIPAPSQVLTADIIQQAIPLLEKAMDCDKLYLNPTLTVDMVAQNTGLPAKTISAVLNQHLLKSFNEFVNGYRVQAFKQKVLLPEMEALTIAGIAYDCGFNSQATFQRTFKQVTGMSPTAFRKHQLEMS